MPIALVLSVLVLQILLIFTHLAVYAVAAAAFGIGGLLFKTIFVVLAFTFLSASLLAHTHKGRFFDWYYAAAAYWFGLVSFLFGGAVAFFFIAKVLYSFNYYVSPAFLGGVLFGFSFFLHLYGTWKSGRAEITRIDIAVPGLPEAWRTKKIVFVSDFHLGKVWRREFTEKVAGKIRALAPHAVFIGGDLYDGVACDLKDVIEPLRSLRPPHGVYFITGNHEYFLSDIAPALAAIRNVGIRILEDERVDIDGISVIGVSDKSDKDTAHREDHFRKILNLKRLKTRNHEEKHFEKRLNGTGAQGDQPTILLKHEPDYLEIANEAGIALGLFGHTHHGQIFPLNYLTWRIYHGFDYGLHRVGNMQTYTSSGVGTWGPPLRLKTKSEIVLITLR